MAVGDDDQSIYGWRGARIENIQRYSDDFKDVATIRLEQNYRSTGNILKAANSLIRRNAGRLGKELWTAGGDGEPIRLYAAYNDLDEARFITERAQGVIDTGGSPDDVAVLYRSNAQSRVIEEALMLAGIPYRIHGGYRFFERAEIKNALSYMRLIHDRHADPAFERVVNTPTRGIGEKTVEVIRREARERSVSLWQACKDAIVDARLPGRAAGSVGAFLKLIDDLAEACEELELHKLTEFVIRESGPAGVSRPGAGRAGSRAQGKPPGTGERQRASSPANWCFRCRTTMRRKCRCCRSSSTRRPSMPGKPRPVPGRRCSS